MTVESRGWRRESRAVVAVLLFMLMLGVAYAVAAGDPAFAATLESPHGLFERNCAGCHGRTGTGADAPSLEAAAFPGLVEGKITAGGGGMPAFVDAPGAARIPLIVSFVVDQIALPQARLATVSEGGRLYRLYCGGCHGATARGGALYQSKNAPSLANLPAANALAAMIVGPGNMPTFAAAALDVRQQAAVARYVAVMRDPPSPGGNGLGYLGPVTEGALSIVLGLGLLVLVSVWLGWRKGGNALE
jgi:ubiquinol-cytochrome c reductase cytochrome c subunit